MIPPVSSKAEQLQTLERFQQEAQVIKQLEHSAALKVRDFGRTDEGLPFLVTEFIRGRELSAVLQEAPLSLERTIRVSKQVLSCLAEAHHLRIIHRDLKPANLMIRDIYGEHDSVKVLDFGISKILGESGVKTQTGLRFGTPWYMAPEQAKGLKDIDGRLDLYAFGLIMAECLTGRRVVAIDDMTGALLQQASPEPLPFEPAVMQSPLFPVIRKATQKDPNHRFPDAIAMREAVEAVEVQMLVATSSASGPLPTGPSMPDTGPAGPSAPIPVATVASQPSLAPPPSGLVVTPNLHQGLTTPLPEAEPGSQAIDLGPPGRDLRRPVAMVLVGLVAIVGVLVAVLLGGDENREGPTGLPIDNDPELSVCDQAADHYLDCVDRFCGDVQNAGNPNCDGGLRSVIEERGAQMECNEEAQSSASEVLRMTCEDLTASMVIEDTVCHQAAVHLHDCVFSFCGDDENVDHPMCHEDVKNQARGSLSDPTQCDGTRQLGATQALEFSCEEFAAFFGGAPPESDFQIVVDDAQRAIDEGRWFDALRAAREVPPEDNLHDRAQDIVNVATDHLLDDAQHAMDNGDLDGASGVLGELLEVAPSDRVLAFEVELTAARDALEREEREREEGSLERQVEAEVGVGRPSVEGHLDREIIQRVVRQHRREVRDCYSEVLERDPDLGGRVIVRFTIDPSGTVASAGIQESDLDNDDVEDCLLRRIERWRFPEPSTPGLVHVTYPFIFSPQ